MAINKRDLEEELKKVRAELLECEGWRDHEVNVHDPDHNVRKRLDYEKKKYRESVVVSRFFTLLLIIYPHLSRTQLNKFNRSIGTVSVEFFSWCDIFKLLNAVMSPLFGTQYRSNGQINLFSNEFDNVTFGKYRKFESGKFSLNPDGTKRVVANKRYTCKYDREHLTIALAILEVSIFILEVLLPVWMNDEEYNQSLRSIGISDEKSIKFLCDIRRRNRRFLLHFSLRIKRFFREGILRKRSVTPMPKAFHQEVYDSLTQNQDFMRFLWNTCDTCQRKVNHGGFWRPEVICKGCGGECEIL
jgi:hypothetical protein